MSKKQRRILFYSCVGIFLVLSYFVALYAIGYKYDFLNNRFIKTGSLHIKSQNSASIFINDRKIEETSFFNNSFSKGGLLPREYRVRIERNGYFNWQKAVAIKEGLISDFPSVYLVKKELVLDIVKNPSIASISFSSVSSVDSKTSKLVANLLNVSSKEIRKVEKKSNYLYALVRKNGSLYKIENNEDGEKPKFLISDIEDFISSYDIQKLAWYSKNELWVQWLKDSDRQPYKKTGDEELIIRTVEAIRKVQWHADGNYLFVLVGNKIEFIELDGRGGRNSYIIYENSDIRDINYDKNNKRLLILLPKNILSVEI